MTRTRKLTLGITALVIVILLGAVIVLSLASSPLGGVAIPEDEGKKNVMERPEVQELYARHGADDVYIQALEIDLAHDREFIQKLRPDISPNIGCIIVVKAGQYGADGYVYFEDENLHIVRHETLSEFLSRTRGVDPEVLAQFYLSLH